MRTPHRYRSWFGALYTNREPSVPQSCQEGGAGFKSTLGVPPVNDPRFSSNRGGGGRRRMGMSQPDVAVGHARTRADMGRIARDKGVQQSCGTVEQAERLLRVAVLCERRPKARTRIRKV